MHWQLVICEVALLLGAATSLAVALYIGQRRSARGAAQLSLLMLAVAGWSLAYALELMSPDLLSKVFFSKAEYLGIAIVAPAWFSFAVHYTGYGRTCLHRHRLLFACIPAATVLLAWSNEWHHLIWRSLKLDNGSALAVLTVSHGSWFWVHTIYSYLLLLAGTFILFRSLMRMPELYLVQIATLLVGALAPWLANAAYILHLNPVAPLDLTPFAFTLTGLSIAWSLFHFQLLDIVPLARGTVIENMGDAVIVLDEQGRIVDLNPAAVEVLGQPAAQALGQPAALLLCRGTKFAELCHDAMEAQTEIELGDGKAKRHFDLHKVLQKAHEQLEMQVQERTAELARANEALRKSEERYRILVEQLPAITWVEEPGAKVTYMSPQVEQIMGYSVEEFTADDELWASRLHPEDRERMLAAVQRMREQGEPLDIEYRTYARNGRLVWLHDQAKPMRDEAGNIVFFQGLVTDISERKRLQEQLIQAQKMETVGRLAGGIAHDFNNLLTAIIGYADFALHELADPQAAQEDITEMLKVAERAKNLISQLLAFSRQQIIAPKPLNLNDLILDMDKMLRRLIGEHIELVTLPAPDLGLVKADRGQMEQVLVNLVVNARDAMTEGGTLTIETATVSLDETYKLKDRELEPGDYAMLAVSDNGIGMSEEVKAHLFEPFFTTKEVGKGTGLGLATVYGIVKQHGGHIWAYSEPGEGTTFKVYLPLTQEQMPDAVAEVKPSSQNNGTEVVLVAEDEPAVRAIAVRMLSKLGYSVLKAATGEEGLRLAKEHVGPIHLLVTDVVMPQMSGKELVERLKLIRPRTKVLFISGYTDNDIHHHGILDEDVAFLQKPFSEAALAKKVREVLDGNGQPH